MTQSPSPGLVIKLVGLLGLKLPVMPSALHPSHWIAAQTQTLELGFHVGLLVGSITTAVVAMALIGLVLLLRWATYR